MDRCRPQHFRKYVVLDDMSPAITVEVQSVAGIVGHSVVLDNAALGAGLPDDDASAILLGDYCIICY